MYRKSISVTEASVIAAQFFNLTLPVTTEDLRQAFRREQHRLHPDKNPGREETATNQFKVMSEAYDRLITCAEAFKEITNTLEETEDGTPINELGKGLGELVNAMDCSACATRGYYVIFRRKETDCTHCKGTGRQKVKKPCRSCRGTTQFKKKNGRMVPCRDCSATGKVEVFSKFNPRPCAEHCFNGRVEVPDQEQPVYHTCRQCDGAGAIRIYNPVIPKGRLMS